MSTPENPFGKPEPPPMESGSGSPPVSLDLGVQRQFPVWGVGDLARVLAVLLLAIFFADFAAVMIADILPFFRHVNPRALATDARVVVPAQGCAYLITVWFVVRMISHHYRQHFFQAVHWRFPEKWLKFLFGGIMLAIVIQALSARLPIPKQMPIDQFFRSTAAAWMMATFGTLIAPFCEELFFRGLLFPVLVRRIGLFAGIVLTSVLFALIHSSQLANAWGPVAMLFLVGVVLTVVRIRAHSLAASVLVHAGYNLALFSLLYIGSAGFHDFSRIAR